MTILFSDQFHDQEEKAVNVARDLRMPQFELEKVGQYSFILHLTEFSFLSDQGFLAFFYSFDIYPAQMARALRVLGLFPYKILIFGQNSNLLGPKKTTPFFGIRRTRLNRITSWATLDNFDFPVGAHSAARPEIHFLETYFKMFYHHDGTPK